MDQDDAPSDGTGPRPGNVIATASAGDGRASAHVRVEILLHGTGPAESRVRDPGNLPVAADTQRPANAHPPSARTPRRVAAATLVAAVLVAAFAAGALIF